MNKILSPTLVLVKEIVKGNKLKDAFKKSQEEYIKSMQESLMNQNLLQFKHLWLNKENQVLLGKVDNIL